MEREAELLGDLYAEKVGRQATKTEVLANGKSVVRVLSPEEIRTELISVMPVTEGELRTLAQRRAQSVREALVGEGKVPEDRLFLVDVDLVDSKEQKVRTRLNVTGA
jgi:DNA-directed RNA polymerase subunit F